MGVGRRRRRGNLKKREKRPEGQIRLSQVVSTFGPGSMVDLLDHAVLIGGLDFWGFDGPPKKIHEPRLREALAEQFRRADRKLSMEEPFLEPPGGDDNNPIPFNVGIKVLEFPHWFVCQNPECRALVGYRGLELKGNKRVHDCSRTKRFECVAVRFVSACRRGHLDDFPWPFYVHEMNGVPRCASPGLRLLEGASGDFSEIRVVCECGARRKLSDALAPEANPKCQGFRPWLGPEGREECGEPTRLMVRTASNSYFSQVVSALSVPEEGRELHNVIEELWEFLETADESTLPAFRNQKKVKPRIAPYSDEEVLEVVRAIRRGKPTHRDPLRTAEYKQFVAAPDEQPGDLPDPDSIFYVRTRKPAGLPPYVVQVVLAHKLREVRAQIGFTRIEPATPNLQGEFDLGVQSAELGLQTDWLPATEVRGEGVFIRFSEDAVREWETRDAVASRAQELLAAYDIAMKPPEGVEAPEPPPFPGARFYMLHSLSHLLISAISLECGYAASAIRERIYCAPAASDFPMAAVLLQTGTSGTEGTLGGLVAQGRRIEDHLARAIEMGRLCSNDPVCAAHSPYNLETKKADPAERYFEGSACHGCLFIAECSCERFNRYLDRALVVPTIGRDPELAFLK